MTPEEKAAAQAKINADRAAAEAAANAESPQSVLAKQGPPPPKKTISVATKRPSGSTAAAKNDRLIQRGIEKGKTTGPLSAERVPPETVTTPTEPRVSKKAANRQAKKAQKDPVRAAQAETRSAEDLYRALDEATTQSEKASGNPANLETIHKVLKARKKRGGY